MHSSECGYIGIYTRVSFYTSLLNISFCRYSCLIFYRMRRNINQFVIVSTPDTKVRIVKVSAHRFPIDLIVFGQYSYMLRILYYIHRIFCCSLKYSCVFYTEISRKQLQLTLNYFVIAFFVFRFVTILKIHCI